MNYKYGIKCIDLQERYPNFIEDYKNNKIIWKTASEYITGCIRTFLICFVKLKFTTLDCQVCSYPHNTSADYIVLCKTNELSFLLSILKDNNFYPNNAKRIEMMKEGLLFLDCNLNELNSQNEVLTYNQVPSE